MRSMYIGVYYLLYTINSILRARAPHTSFACLYFVYEGERKEDLADPNVFWMNGRRKRIKDQGSEDRRDGKGVGTRKRTGKKKCLMASNVKKGSSPGR